MSLAALQTLLQESGSVLSDVKRNSASSDIGDRSFKLPKVNPSVTTVLEGGTWLPLEQVPQKSGLLWTAEIALGGIWTKLLIGSMSLEL